MSDCLSAERRQKTTDFPSKNEKINYDVQLKENGWVKILSDALSSIPLEDYSKKVLKKESLPIVEVRVQLLKPCIATRGSMDAGQCFELLASNIQEYKSECDIALRCDYRLKVFCTFYSSGGDEIATESQYIDAKWLTKSRKIENFPGEKFRMTFLVPDSAVSWYVWVPK